jgi:MFS family permease
MPFMLVCVATLCSFVNYMMLNPVLPLQVARLGETAAFVGITIAAFSGASVVARPFMGSAVDRRGSAPVFAIGAGLLAVASLAYVVPSLVVLLAARSIHGIGWAALNTAGTTLAADVVPAHRRGEAMGWLSLSKAVASAGAPAVGLLLLTTSGFDGAFLVAATVGGLGLGLALWLTRRTARRNPPGHSTPLTLDTSSIIPAAILALVYAGNPLLQSFVVLLAAERAIEGLPTYFLVSGVVLVLVQPLARISDRVGRGPNMAIGLVVVAAALSLALVARDLPMLIMAGALWSAGSGLVEPTATALAIDLAPPDRRGAAMATYTAAFQVGNASGALVWGVIIAALGFEAAFAGAVACIVVALVVLRATWHRVRAARPAVPVASAG